MAKKIKSTQAKRGLAASTKARAAAGVMGVAALFGPVACDNGTISLPKLCECPNGTVHNNFGCECGGEGCICTHTMYHLNYGVILEDQTDGVLTSTHIQIINNALDDLTSYNMQDVKITIVPGNNVTVSGSELKIGITQFNVPTNIKDVIEIFLNG